MSEPHPLAPPGALLDGKYIVERTLGEGGMGVVVAARHAVLQTRVAVKILLPGAMAERDTVERFHREARSAVRIKSPHAARVHDVGTLANGTPYMVMELLTGKDLDALVRERGMLSPDEAIGFVRQALEALQEAHTLGIVHRDLKPANLFLADQPNGPPIVKVLDFGIASDFHAGDEQRLTRTRAVMGSPAYMSPEQMRESRSADVRSDIWSMGVCLYELLTGRPPFLASSLPDLFVAVLHGTPVPPESLRSDLPPGLSQIILRCLEKDPARRFQSASALAAALQSGESGASWPAATTSAHSSGRMLIVAPSAAALPSTERLATSRTIADSGATPSRLKYVWLGAVALGVMGAALGVASFVKPRAPVTAAPVRSEPEPSVPTPVDLSNAGVASTGAAPPATGAPAPPTSATTPVSPAPPTPAKVVTGAAGRPARPTPAVSAPPAVSAAPPAAAPPTPPPAPAPTFDPKQAF